MDASARRSRAELDDAAKNNRGNDFERELSERTGDEKFAHTYRRRGRLYDKINVSLHTMDIIIYVIVALIVIALVVGIVIGDG